MIHFEGVRDTEQDLSSVGLPPRWLQPPGPGQVEAKSSMQVSHVGSWGPNTWAFSAAFGSQVEQPALQPVPVSETVALVLLVRPQC